MYGVRANGENFPIEGTYSEVEVGGKTLSTLILRDITHRMGNEAALQRQAQLLHLTHDAIFVWSTLKGVEYWNQGAVKLYGFAADDLMGRVPHEYIKTLYGVPWSQIESELHECSVWEGTLHQMTKDGEEIIVATRMQMIAEDKDKGLVILESNRDITDRHRLEEALIRASEKERHRIGSDLHDGLGQEITGISLLNNVLQNRLDTKKLPEAAIAQQLATLLQHACDEVRRVSHGLQPVSSDSEGLMAGLRTLVSCTNLLKGISCVFRHNKPLIKVHNNEVANHLYRIAQEAVQNALRHGNPQHVTLNLSRTGDQITLDIQDDGIGFDPRKIRSHGTGLRTMKYRAEAMNGTLHLLPLPDRGTLVRCTVPDPQ